MTNHIGGSPIHHRVWDDIIELVDVVFSTQGIQTSISVPTSCRYDGSCDILFVLGNLNAIAITDGHGHLVNSSILKERALWNMDDHLQKNCCGDTCRPIYYRSRKSTSDNL